jgi:phospholipid transport system substrate-binding protein
MMKTMGTAVQTNALTPFFRLRALAFAAVMVCSCVAASNAQAAAADDAAVQKTLKTLVNAIRYSKDDLALRQLNLAGMSQKLMGDAWGQMDEAQRKSFQNDLGRVLAGLSFSRGREIFQYLDAVLYAPVTIEGEQARCKSTVVIHRDLKKKEMPIEWVLSKEGGTYKVVDTIFLGESTAQGVREEQVAPLLKEGGVQAVIKALAAQVAKLPAAHK